MLLSRAVATLPASASGDLTLSSWTSFGAAEVADFFALEDRDGDDGIAEDSPQASRFWLLVREECPHALLASLDEHHARHTVVLVKRGAEAPGQDPPANDRGNPWRLCKTTARSSGTRC